MMMDDTYCTTKKQHMTMDVKCYENNWFTNMDQIIPGETSTMSPQVSQFLGYTFKECCKKCIAQSYLKYPFFPHLLVTSLNEA